MNRRATILTVCMAILGGMALMAQDKNSTSASSSAKKIRIGVYDNRAIAIAWASSKYNPIKQKMEELNKAKAEGNTQKIKELNEWGEASQRKLHRQGFGKVPVDDLLASVKDRLSEVARKSGVVAIVWQNDYSSDNIEVVDVTQELVKLFDPSERTLRITNPEELKKNAPLDLEFIEKHQNEM
jgi:hypothetical protein